MTEEESQPVEQAESAANGPPVEGPPDPRGDEAESPTRVANAASETPEPPESGAPAGAASVAGGATAMQAAVDSARDSAGIDFVLDVPLRVTVEVGGARMHVREVLQLNKGSVVELDRMSGEPADILVNGRLVARGELTVADDRLAVRVVEVIGASRFGH